MKVYIVKSFGSESGYMNLKVFNKEMDAIEFAGKIESQIPDGVSLDDEFVEEIGRAHV